jgi:hypothetical protein
VKFFKPITRLGLQRRLTATSASLERQAGDILVSDMERMPRVQDRKGSHAEEEWKAEAARKRHLSDEAGEGVQKLGVVCKSTQCLHHIGMLTTKLCHLFSLENQRAK